MKKFWQNNKNIIGYLVLLFAVFQAVLLLLSLISPRILPAREMFLYNDGEKPINPVFLWNRANFDGVHYLSIAKRNYVSRQQAFFPLYPKLIKIMTPFFFGKNLIAGLFISSVSLFLFLCIFYKLVLLDFDHNVARRAVFILMIFPTSFFFGFVYTESLLLLFVLGSFYAARKGSWLVAGILGALAANTKLVGIFLFPALLYEFYQKYKIQNTKYKILNLLPIFLVPLGLLSYMRFLKINFNDPLLFIHSDGKMVLLYQVFFRYLKMVLTTKFDPLYLAVWFELFTAVGFIFLLVKCYLRKIRRSYLVFSVLALITPTLTGSFSSLPRYALILFPCFIFLGMIKESNIRKIISVVFILLAVVCAVMFFRGYWIA